MLQLKKKGKETFSCLEFSWNFPYEICKRAYKFARWSALSAPPAETSTTDKNVPTWFRLSARSHLTPCPRLYLVLFGTKEWRGTHDITAVLPVERRVLLGLTHSAVGIPQESVHQMIKWRGWDTDRMWCADTILVTYASNITRIREWWRIST